MNHEGKILIQKRSESVRTNVGKWAINVGAVDMGEASLEGALREVKEELNIDVDTEKLSFYYHLKENMIL